MRICRLSAKMAEELHFAEIAVEYDGVEKDFPGQLCRELSTYHK
jgi:hypothetical protein